MEGTCEVKIILLGESDVGKTSLLLRFIENKFKGTPSRTSINKYEKIIEVEGRLVKLVLWDTAGREAYHSMVRSYYKVAEGVLLVYDVHNANSFSALSKWLTDFKSANKNAEVLIAGNKAEDENKKIVTTVDMEHFLRNERLDCIEVSAKLNKNVTLLFHRIVLRVLNAKGILPYFNKSLPTELVMSDTTLPSSSVMQCNKDTSTSINTSSIAESLVTSTESRDHRTSRKIYPPSTTESVVTCMESILDCISNTMDPPPSTELLASSMELTEHHNSTSRDSLLTTESLATRVKSAQHRNSSTNFPPTTIKLLTVGVESKEQHLSTIKYESNFRTNMSNEANELEDEEDSPDGLLIYSPKDPDRISENDSELLDSAEIAEEYFKATEVKENMSSHLQDDMHRNSGDNSKFIDSAEIAEEHF